MALHVIAIKRWGDPGFQAVMCDKQGRVLLSINMGIYPGFDEETVRQREGVYLAVSHYLQHPGMQAMCPGILVWQLYVSAVLPFLLGAIQTHPQCS